MDFVLPVFLEVFILAASLGYEYVAVVFRKDDFSAKDRLYDNMDVLRLFFL